MYGHISHGSLCSPTATAQLDKTLLEHMAAGGNGSEALIQHDELVTSKSLLKILDNCCFEILVSFEASKY